MIRWCLALATFLSVSANWNDDSVGRSEHYDELELDTFHKKVFQKDSDYVIVFYSDRCSLCQQLHPQQEKAAAKVKKKLASKEIRFGRIDEYREGQAAFYNKFPDFKDGDIPKMYFVKAGAAKPLRVPHGEIGFGSNGNKGSKRLYKWLKENSSFREKLGWKPPKKKPEDDDDDHDPDLDEP